jgi:hypothetical protein
VKLTIHVDLYIHCLISLYGVLFDYVVKPRDNFSSLPNISSRTTALGSTQPLTEISTRILPGGKGWPAR